MASQAACSDNESDAASLSGDEDAEIDMLEGDISDEEDEITNPDLVQIMLKHGQKTKWVVETPRTVERTTSIPAKRKTRSSGKVLDGGAEDPSPPVPKKAKKAPKKTARAASVLEDPPSVSFRTILKIEKPPKAVTGKGKKGQPKEEYLIREPFEFSTQDSFDDYLDSVAVAAPCPRKDLVTTGMLWKPEKPKSAEPNPLRSEQGFRAIVEKMEACRAADRTLILFIKPPRKPEQVDDDRFWDEAEASKSKGGPSFDFSSLEDENPGNAVEQQKMKFESAVRDARIALERRYPIGNNSLFPDQRIYRSPEGWYIELNPLRLASWAWHLHNKTATEDKPPNVAHFDASARIKKVPKPCEPAPIDPGPSTQHPTPHPLPHSAPTSTSNPTDTSSLIQLLVLQQMQQMQAQSFNFMANSQHHRDTVRFLPPRPSTPLSSQAATCSVPPSPAIHINVPLEDFCSHYGISDDNYQKLKSIEYTPGDSNIKSLPREEWKEAGFALLTWKKILDTHDRFCRDIKNGSWENK